MSTIPAISLLSAVAHPPTTAAATTAAASNAASHPAAWTADPVTREWSVSDKKHEQLELGMELWSERYK